MSVIAGRWQRLEGLAHIGFDRMLGYGPKSPEAFDVTPVCPISRTRKTRPS